MEVIFLIPPVKNSNKVPERVFGCSYGRYPMPNIFILTFASILRNDGNQVEIIDAPIMNIDEVCFYKYLKTKSDACFIFYTVNLSMELDIRTSKILRQIHRQAPIIYCGPAATFYSHSLAWDDKTYVIRGEPDYTMKELVQYLRGDSKVSLKDINGMTFLEGTEIIDTPMRQLITNLDELPFPARDLIPKDKYYNPKLKQRPFTTMITSRGCPYRCSFCVPASLCFARKLEYQKHYGFDHIPPVSFASPARVIAEFELLKKYGYKAVSIIDDEFLLKPQRVKEICQQIKEMKFKWGCLARADHLLDEELIQLMAEAGCQYIDIGIESFNQKILNDLNKNLDVTVINQAVKLLKRYNIEPKLNILVAASPLETKKTIRETINRALALKPGLVMFNICTPFPGTELYHRAQKNGWFVNGDYEPVDVQKESIIQYPHLKSDEIEKIVHWANLRFFFQPRFIISHLKNFFNFKDFFLTLKSLIKKL